MLTSLTLPIHVESANADERGHREKRVIAYVIGDSVLLGARQQLQVAGLRLDAVEGRQPARLKGALQELPDDGLPVVIHLGTNGRFDTDACQELIEHASGRRDVVLVTVRAPRSWVRSSNAEIRECADRLSGSATALVPWHRIAQLDPTLVYPDGIHLTPRGAELIVERIRRGLGLCSPSSEEAPAPRSVAVGRDCPREETQRSDLAQ